MNELQSFVDSISISPGVFDLRPDVAVLVVAIDGIHGGPSDDVSRAWLDEACRGARTSKHEEHLEAWRSAYRAFGVKPQKFRPSFDALLRRAPAGMPEINKVVDAYNAASVKFGLPVGGENIDAYQGSLRLARANGTETFDTVSDGQPANEVVDVGEVVWLDDLGVTCRRWNWRQGLRTRVEESSDSVFFVFERLAPFPVDTLHMAAEEVVARLAHPDSAVVVRLIENPA